MASAMEKRVPAKAAGRRRDAIAPQAGTAGARRELAVENVAKAKSGHRGATIKDMMKAFGFAVKHIAEAAKAQIARWME